MVVVEELLFSEVEHKIELFPFRVHWTLLSCEHREREREKERERERERGINCSHQGGCSARLHMVNGFFQSKTSEWALMLL